MLSEEFKEKRFKENTSLDKDRILYSGALYDDVRAAIYAVVRQWRASHNNFGKNSTMKHVDEIMTMPEVIRLYDPFYTTKSWFNYTGCTCRGDCCENHEEE